MSNHKILYEDSSLILIDKPQGLATSPGKSVSLCDYLFDDRPALRDVRGYKKDEGGLLNRLDNDTGGIVFFAKHDEAFFYYNNLMKNERILKTYVACVIGCIEEPEGRIHYSIAHHAKSKKKMIAIKSHDSHIKYRGKPREATSRWSLIKRYENISLLAVKITKGARHQIRIHLAASGMPIIGDKLYNKDEKLQNITPHHLLYAVGVALTTFDNQQIEITTRAAFEDSLLKLDNSLY